MYLMNCIVLLNYFCIADWFRKKHFTSGIYYLLLDHKKYFIAYRNVNFKSIKIKKNLLVHTALKF